jgi:type II secretory pathway predicted ATPase ExeA
MYQAYWGLKHAPFASTAESRDLSASPVHAEALARLDFLRESRCPFGLLLGSAGSGKSAVLTAFAERARRDGTLAALVNAAGSDELTFLTPLAIGLQIEVEQDAATLWRRLVDRLDELKLECLTGLLLLDDLDRAAANVLAIVERLLGRADAPLTIVATARHETAARIGVRLLDHAGLRIDLSPWNEAETRDYLSTSLASAGRLQPAFNEAAARRLFELSGGAPRKVNQLAQLALIAGAGQRVLQIDQSTIEAVQEELSVAR